jgi:hypothetical protein
MRYEFWKKIISRVPSVAVQQQLLFIFREAARRRPLAGHIFPTVYNVALYSTWEAQ